MKPKEIFTVYDSYGANTAYFSSQAEVDKFVKAQNPEPHQFDIHKHILDTHQWE
jgi:hypothetical protein